MTARVPDFLARYLVDLPFFRALLRAVEAKMYQSLPLRLPILDLGCGDGHFGGTAFRNTLDVGLDAQWEAVRQAAKRNAYRRVVQGNGYQMPFAEGVFNTVISNSVLEHIPQVNQVLAETSRVLNSGSLFLFSVPNHRFLQNLSIARFMDRIHGKSLAAHYRRFFNHLSRHCHSDSEEVWQQRLETNGFDLEQYWHYFSPQALTALEWGHYLGLPDLVSYRFFGKWHLLPYSWNFSLIRRILQPYYDESYPQPEGVYTFYIARKR
jgi:SAM-dependent methyltransferase